MSMPSTRQRNVSIKMHFIDISDLTTFLDGAWGGPEQGDSVGVALRNLRLNKLRQQHQRLLPAQVAHLGRDRCGHAFLGDAELGAAGHRLQGDGGLHFAGQVRIVECVGVADAFVRHEFEIFAAERMALPGAEVGERHPAAAADLRFQMVDLGGEAVRRQPLDQGVGVEKRAVDPFGRRAQHAVQADGAGGHGLSPWRR